MTRLNVSEAARRCGGAALLLACFATAQLLWAGDHGRVYELRRQGKILPLEQIIQMARLHPDDRIIEVELEDEHGVLVYELEIIGADGIVRERLYDARSGQLIKEEREDD